MSHSAEPWKLTMEMILDATEGVVAAMKGPSGLTKEDMQRIVLCVNACQRFSDEDLVKYQLRLVPLQTETAEAKVNAGTATANPMYFTNGMAYWTNTPITPQPKMVQTPPKGTP